MMVSYRSGIRAIAAAAVLLAGAACQKQDSGRQADRGQRSGSAGSSQQQTSSSQTSPSSSGQGATAMKQPEQSSKQQATAQQSSSSTERTVQGRIVRAGQEEIVVRQGTGDKPDLRLKVGPETTVMVGGQKRSVGDLQEGTQVRASYDESNGSPQATKIEAMGRGNP